MKVVSQQALQPSGRSTRTNPASTKLMSQAVDGKARHDRMPADCARCIRRAVPSLHSCNTVQSLQPAQHACRSLSHLGGGEGGGDGGGLRGGGMLQASQVIIFTSTSSADRDTSKGWNEAVTKYHNRLEPQDMA